jgi:alpha-glucan, water dikinase
MQILPLIQSAVACRLELHSSLPGNKDLIYLDLALEQVVRAAMERGIGALGIGAAAFVGPLLQNLVRAHTAELRRAWGMGHLAPCAACHSACMQVLTAGENEELCYCLKAWQALPRSVQYGATPNTVEALQATAVVDRVRRALGELSTSVTDRIQVRPAPHSHSLRARISCVCALNCRMR